MTLPYFTAEEVAAQHTQIKGALHAQPSWGLRDGHLNEWLDGIPHDAAITDVGSGSGELERQLFQKGYLNITSVDLDRYFDINQIGGEPTFVRADISRDSFGLPDASQDVVFSLQVLEHLENPWHCAREILRITKPGGRIVISIPHATSVINRWRFFWTGDVEDYTVQNNHIALFSNAVFHKLWKNQVRFCSTCTSEGYVKLSGGRKIRIPARYRLGRMFARKVAFVLEKR